MTDREWKVEALWYLVTARKMENSKIRIDREWAGYVKRFFFGEGDWSFDGKNETWQLRKARKVLPLSLTQYYVE